MMKKANFIKVFLAFSALSISSMLQAQLLSRLGGQAYYDTALDITWLADANLAVTEAFGITGDGIRSNGTMTGDTALQWISAMNAYLGTGYLGFDDWHLPTIKPVNGMAFNVPFSAADGSLDIGYNISAPGSVYPDSTGSAMAHLFYNTLGNIGHLDVDGNETGCFSQVTFCLSNSGPFSGLQPREYWSETGFPSTSDSHFVFIFSNGLQRSRGQTAGFGYVWAVRDGDVISSVPLPATFGLFASGLLALLSLSKCKEVHCIAGSEKGISAGRLTPSGLFT